MKKINYPEATNNTVRLFLKNDVDHHYFTPFLDTFWTIFYTIIYVKSCFKIIFLHCIETPDVAN